MTKKLGVGLDIGTMNIVAARKEGKKVEFSRIRDAFVELPEEAARMLKLSNISYIEKEVNGEKILILLGDAAQDAALFRKEEVRRPLSQGLISSSETDALGILKILIENVLGEPSTPGEVCCFSIPANPVDMEMNNIFHKAMFEDILEDLGYEPLASNEAHAIIFSEAADTMFSGIGISYGSGMVNVCLSWKTLSMLEFSMARGGDWIDKQSANAVGKSAVQMCKIKEKGFNLMAPETNEQRAIATFYKDLIKYSLREIAKKLSADVESDQIEEPIPIIVSGGTSLPEGFLPLFETVFERMRRKFPVEISEIRHAQDPLGAVAQGLLIQALEEHEDDS